MTREKYHKSIINAAAGLFGARVISADWGPRGVREVLGRVKSRGFLPAIIFDIGASNGQWTRDCRRIFTKAHYVLVEPLPSNREALLTMQQSDDRVRVYLAVAGARPGVVQLYDHGDQSSVLSSDDFPGARRDVEATTVDSIFALHGSPSPVLLKADVQGYELEVLRGAEECLKCAEVLILEVSFRRIYKDSALAHEIISYVAERGFLIYEICSYMQRASDRDLVQSDLVFVHESSALLGRHGWK
ncbi:MAG: FkbM family methyltransferase [Steroidobacteraceae bacterium]